MIAEARTSSRRLRGIAVVLPGWLFLLLAASGCGPGPAATGPSDPGSASGSDSESASSAQSLDSPPPSEPTEAGTPGKLSEASPWSGKPNVVMVVVDTLRADHLTEYGHSLDTSGQLKPVLSDSTRFVEAYSPSSWTLPSTASLHTGLLPVRHRARAGDNARLDEQWVTLAERLHEAGWSTGGFSANPNVSNETGFGQGFDRFDDRDADVHQYPPASVLIERAQHWLQGVQRPYFLYLQPMNVHGPYTVPETALSELLGRAPTKDFDYAWSGAMKIMVGELARRRRVDEALLTSLREQYDTAIRYSADQLADLFAWLASRGDFDNSLVVVTADHGEELYDHGGFSHGYSLHQELVRVPLFVKLPHQNRGLEIRGRASLVDLLPTILNVLDLEPADDVDGRPLTRWLRPGAASAREASTGGSPSEIPARDLIFEVSQPKRCIAQALLSGSWKVIRVERSYESQEGRTLLFDLESDPDESRDLSASEAGRADELLQRMESYFAALRRRQGEIPESRRQILDEKRLKALGYL